MLAAELKPAQGGPPRSSPATTSRAWREVSDPLAPFLADVRRFLEAQVATFEEEVAEGARYALSASGKQLRPVLVALSARAVGSLQPSHVTGAAIVELVHLATLVHDDVIDAAGVRRQLPTVAARFGNRTAVLLGDCLFAHALKLASGYPTTDVCRAVSAATKAVCSGEILQTLRPGRVDQPIEQYFRILQLKTAELFALACEIGALLATHQAAHRTSLRRFGLEFGTAYQIFDDCLDVFGNEQTAGKTLGTDLANGKVTLPILLAYQRASPSDRQLIERFLGGTAPAAPPGIRPVLARYGAAAACRDVVDAHLHSARSALAFLGSSDGSSALLALTVHLADQAACLVDS
ncbi:MAG: polyprenyl synthetase family protein [Verrucomicrobiae bacterium]|nr:polyprenyl synthetase family protein [Verrucomicrobiae bacterium]